MRNWKCVVYKQGYMVIWAILLGVLPFSVKGQCEVKNYTFKAGETVTYHAYYNWHFIWLNAGIVHFSVQNKTYNERDAWFLSAYGRTYKGYDKFMKVRDTFEVFVDKEQFAPLYFNRVTNEGSTKAHHKYWFNHDSRTIKTQIKKDDSSIFKEGTIALEDCTADLLSMVYKARNINYSTYKVNEKIPITMIVDGKIHHLFIRYLGKEIIKNRDGRKFRCLKFSPLLVPGTIFKSGEDMVVWVSDDNARVPIIVEAKVLIGSVKAVFVDAVGLRNPIEAEVLD
ncbi:Protein of unknown function [Saccharicrinis carchari]|uniref:DUF3108 domain-containing protein n=1 Tax=Saccharicrinis carchari TaxID=1168039 RepID=A0A521D359_SACCC|nr:DUF3108 domain-containing protein [Saccharicrinis carchari]SMO66136.1 Protein of unknown function [Saccharicrinis carchari]